MPTRPTDSVLIRDLYLDLLKKALMDSLHDSRTHRIPVGNLRIRGWKTRLLQGMDRMLRSRGYLIARDVEVSAEDRMRGRGPWPVVAETMVGIDRLNNVQACIEDVLTRGIPGDLIETGVWRGGMTIFMRAVLKAYQVADRKVWVADSFQGLPKPNEDAYPADKGDTYHLHEELSVSLSQVKKNFARYGLLDDQVRFLEGWFSETLPTAPIQSLAVLRLDGDMYESTMDALVHLYPKLSTGGYIIVDDYQWIPACRQAVTNYRNQHGIEDPIRDVDWTAVYWQKSGSVRKQDRNEK